MTNIYAFPPVGSVGREWTEETRVARSSYLFSGKRAVSSLGPRRRLASLTVSALALGRNGAGYSESLKRLLDGGLHLVRLWSWPVNWHLDAADMAALLTEPLSWTSGGVPLIWTSGGVPLLWFTGANVQGVAGTDAAGFPILTLSGLPPGQLVLRPFDVVRVFPTAGGASVAARGVGAVSSDGAGAAVVRLHGALPTGTVSLGDVETAAFEVTSMPRAVQPVGADWTYEWGFREVLAAEITDPVEVNPWA